MSASARRVVIASRGSALALRQSESVAASLRAAHPGLETEVIAVKTRGDHDRRPFGAIGGKGLFVAEVERAVADGAADLAVHSAKDLTADLAKGCAILAVPPRAPAHDVVVGGSAASGAERLDALAPGSQVGTSSTRRRALLAETRPDLEAVEFRGNLDTRLRNVRDGVVPAAIVAAAGLARLEVDDQGAALDPDWWIPAPGQGALAIEGLAGRADLAELLRPLDDEASASELACERAFSARLEGGCSIPIGCLARSNGGRLVVTGYLGSPGGDRGLRDRISGPADSASDIGRELAEAILGAGGDEILEELRDAELTQPSEP